LVPDLGGRDSQLKKDIINYVESTSVYLSLILTESCSFFIFQNTGKVQQVQQTELSREYVPHVE